RVDHDRLPHRTRRLGDGTRRLSDAHQLLRAFTLLSLSGHHFLLSSRWFTSLPSGQRCPISPAARAAAFFAATPCPFRSIYPPRRQVCRRHLRARTRRAPSCLSPCARRA